MLIFPSYLLHAVYPFRGEGERRSIAFNARYQMTTEASGKLSYVAGNKNNFNLKTNYFD